jgi:hypothetical protein
MPLKKVTRAEHDAFLAAYPRKLERDVVRFFEPPLIQHNDFTLGKWPESVVASYWSAGGDPNNLYAPVPTNWRILKEE